jgi:hypothetical protein
VARQLALLLNPLLLQDRDRAVQLLQPLGLGAAGVHHVDQLRLELDPPLLQLRVLGVLRGDRFVEVVDRGLERAW